MASSGYVSVDDNLAGLLKLTWDQVDGIMTRAVWFDRKGCRSRLTIYKTSFQKQHEYVTVLIDWIETSLWMCSTAEKRLI